jgi:hypothetical protein
MSDSHIARCRQQTVHIDISPFIEGNTLRVDKPYVAIGKKAAAETGGTTANLQQNITV